MVEGIDTGWVKGHALLLGNHLADYLARKSLTLPPLLTPIPATRSDTSHTHIPPHPFHTRTKRPRSPSSTSTTAPPHKHKITLKKNTLNHPQINFTPLHPHPPPQINFLEKTSLFHKRLSCDTQHISSCFKYINRPFPAKRPRSPANTSPHPVLEIPKPTRKRRRV